MIKNVGHGVQLRPLPRRPTPGSELPPVDDDWIIERADDQGLFIHNVRTDHAFILAYDQIHSYMSNPMRGSADGRAHGFLWLRVQLSLLPQTIDVEPLPPGEWGSTKKQEPVSSHKQSTAKSKITASIQLLPALDEEGPKDIDVKELALIFVNDGDTTGHNLSFKISMPTVKSVKLDNPQRMISVL